MMIDIAMQARDFRRRLGFSSQGAVKDFLGAKNITPTVDLAYIELLNTRLFELVASLNGAVSPDIRHSDLEAFRQEYIIQPHRIMLEHNILPRLNNQGRRPEQVYYSWMRGFVLANYFLKALGVIIRWWRRSDCFSRNGFRHWLFILIFTMAKQHLSASTP
jgi:hypothetical protein